MRSPVVSGENGRAVFDSAYYWPHFTPIEGAPRTTELREHDVALFTLSKLTGHAGTRIGWAVTRDETVATRIAAFVKNAGELPRENQLRGLAVLTVLANQGPGGALLATALKEMERRWGLLEKVLSSSRCYAMQDRGTATKTDAWSADGAPRKPTPAYVWLECLPGAVLAGGESCYDRLLAWNVKGVHGKHYGDQVT
mmetsp:Transcript_67415/g.185882  ORF Transcript_67415/g.185882 Transcript_67415/m.185882 type:complete len:197 (-) Transcript_67415:346-936(-)